MPSGVGVIIIIIGTSLLKIIPSLCHSDITSGHVHLNTLDRSVYQPTKWTVANVAHLSFMYLG